MGCANPEGATGANIARQIALRPACRSPSSGMTVNRFCSSGLQTIAMAAQRIIAGEGDVYVAGGVESISCVQQEMNTAHAARPGLDKHKPEIYWNMLQTAEQVAKRYDIGRDAHGRVRRRQPAEGLRRAGSRPFKDEIAPITVQGRRGRPGDGPAHQGSHRRARTKACAPAPPRKASAASSPALPGGVITAGNASQFSDGAGACVVVSEEYAEQQQPEAAGPLPRLRGGRLRARRDGHRPGVRRAQGAQAPGPEGQRHRPVGAERSLRGAGDLLPRQAGHPGRPPERQRRRHRRRPPLRRVAASA